MERTTGRMWRRVAMAAAVVLISTATWAAERNDKAAEALGWKLGVQCWTWNKRTTFESIDKAKEMGLKYIELFPGQKMSADSNAKVDHNMKEEDLKALQAKLKEAGITANSYGVVATGDNEASARKVFEFAKKLGIGTIVSEPNESAMAMLDKLCGEYEINLAIHNHPKPSHYWNPDTALKALEGRSKRMGVCADVGHWARSEIKPIEALKKMEGRIIELHFKDLNEFGKRNAHDVVWGTGSGDVKAQLEELKRQGFKGAVIIEYEHFTDKIDQEVGDCVKAFDKYAEELNK